MFDKVLTPQDSVFFDWNYDNERPHTAIGGVPPRQLLQAA